eukprot:6454844-Amphidinium_carterae.1
MYCKRTGTHFYLVRVSQSLFSLFGGGFRNLGLHCAITCNTMLLAYGTCKWVTLTDGHGSVRLERNGVQERCLEDK